MISKRPLGISLIGYFYFFGAVVLLITLFSKPMEQFGIAMRFGLPFIPENVMRVSVAILSLVMAYGYLNLNKWGFWLMAAYLLYFLTVSIMLAYHYKSQFFYGNVIWSIIVLTYTVRHRLCFIQETFAS